MKEEKCYSPDGEYYGDFDSVMAALESEYEAGIKVTIYEGVPRKITHAEYISPVNIIDLIMESAYADMGEFAENYLCNFQADTVAMSELKELLTAWLDKKVGPAEFWGVSEETEIEVTVGKD